MSRPPRGRRRAEARWPPRRGSVPRTTSSTPSTRRTGEVSAIRTIDVDTELDLSTLLHTHTVATCVDADGREIVLDATSVANVVIPGGHMRMNEIACSGTLDGRPAILHVEMGWGETYAQNYSG